MGPCPLSVQLNYALPMIRDPHEQGALHVWHALGARKLQINFHDSHDSVELTKCTTAS
jgi:hypothetical protein